MTDVLIEVSEDFPHHKEQLLQDLEGINQELEMTASAFKDLSEGEFIESSVLISLIYTRKNCVEVILTVRNNNISIIDDEVCLPGGNSEPNDKTIVDTALREAKEELGITPDHLNIVSMQVPPVIARRNKKFYKVRPVVGVVCQSFYAKLHRAEVVDVFTVPLHDFVDRIYIDKNGGNYLTCRGIVESSKEYKVRGVTLLVLYVLACYFYHKDMDPSVFLYTSKQYREYFKNLFLDNSKL